MPVDKNVPVDVNTMKRLRELRMEVWNGGAKGLIGGLGFGVVGHEIVKHHPSFKKKLNKNTLVGTVLLAGCLGSFLGAVVRGKNSIQYVGDIFRRGNYQSASSYDMQMAKNEKEILNSFDESFHRRDAAIKANKLARFTQDTGMEHWRSYEAQQERQRQQGVPAPVDQQQVR